MPEKIPMSNEIINETQLLERLEGDEEFLLDLIDTYLAESDQVLEDVLDAVTRHDVEGVHRAAHKLKGTLSIFGSRETTEAALALETMGRDRNLDKADAACAHLRHRMADLGSSLAALKERHSHSPECEPGSSVAGPDSFMRKQ
jgi:HPt (histidine-containing phosphotransfer) domain-containing protein